LMFYLFHRPKQGLTVTETGLTGQSSLTRGHRQAIEITRFVTVTGN